jgi:hypothetical protein
MVKGKEISWPSFKFLKNTLAPSGTEGSAGTLLFSTGIWCISWPALSIFLTAPFSFFSPALLQAANNKKKHDETNNGLSISLILSYKDTVKQQLTDTGYKIQLLLL